MKLKAICFGAANGGKELYEKISEKYEVVCFTDNDSRKWGKELYGLSVISPAEAVKEKEYDEIVITSAPGCISIKEQLVDMGVPETKIVSHYVESRLKARIVFLESLAQIFREKEMRGACAEVGVFQGDFAKCINKNFAEKPLYLFDTFEGFQLADIQEERKKNLSEAEVADYSNSSVEMVLSKMVYPEKCIIKKGYFPKTANDVDEEFCFVNLDVDLYLPTLNGLKWFLPRMKKDGVILVHDYFATNFRGPKQAVDEFMQLTETKNLSMCPIGDGISILITGF